MFIKPAKKVIFVDDPLEISYNSMPDNNIIKKAIHRTIESLKINVYYGKNIPKRQIPKLYIKKYNIDNLWWTPLPDGWRLVYSVLTPNNIEILAVILDYFNHKEYEKRFKY